MHNDVAYAPEENREKIAMKPSENLHNALQYVNDTCVKLDRLITDMSEHVNHVEAAEHTSIGLDERQPSPLFEALDTVPQHIRNTCETMQKQISLLRSKLL